MARYGIGDEVLGDWRIVREIGSGGFGTVFEVDKPGHGFVARAALKVIPVPPGPETAAALRAEGMDDASVAAYFLEVAKACASEAGALASLGHPGIVAYQDHGLVQDGEGWDVLLRMELLEPLEGRCAQGLPAPEVAELGAQVADALAYCHAHGYVHRDVKPQNVFVDPSGRYKIGDFGVARAMEGAETTLTRAGTPPYMAPELLSGAHAGPKVDVYSLGVMLYQLLNGGRLPFYPAAPAVVTPAARNDAMRRRLRGELPPAIPGVDPVLMDAVLSACRADPTERPTAAELRDALQAWSRGSASAAAPSRAFGLAGVAPEPTVRAFQEPMAGSGPQTAPAAVPTLTRGIWSEAGLLDDAPQASQAQRAPWPPRPDSPAAVVDRRAPEASPLPPQVRDLRPSVAPATEANDGASETAEQAQQAPWPPKPDSPAAEAPAGVPEPAEQAAHALEPADDDLAARTYDAWTPFGEAPRAQGEPEREPAAQGQEEQAAERQEAPEPAPAAQPATPPATPAPKPDPDPKGRSLTRRALVAAALALGAGGIFMLTRRADDKPPEADAPIVWIDPSVWTDLVAIASGDNHHLGVRRDGTVLAAGGNEHGQRDVSGWRDIVAVSASGHSIGLRADGTAVAAGDNKLKQCDVSEWKDLVAVAAGSTYSLGVRKDGRVLVTGMSSIDLDEVAGWTGISAVAAGNSHVLGLRSDGTAVACGDNSLGKCDVQGWTDLTALAAASSFSVGLRTDGTALAVGSDGSITAHPENHAWKNEREMDIAQWTDLVAVSTDMHAPRCVGLRSDGTTCFAGIAGSASDVVECVLGWTELSAISINQIAALGLKKDGSVLVTGSYRRGENDYVSAVQGEA